MTNKCESPKHRNFKQAKGVGRSEPKGRQPGSPIGRFGIAGVALPVQRWGLTYLKGTCRNVVNPLLSPWGNLLARVGDRAAGIRG